MKHQTPGILHKSLNKTSSSKRKPLHESMISALLRTGLQRCAILRDVCEPADPRAPPCHKCINPIPAHTGMSPLPEGTVCLPACTDRKCPGEPDVSRAGKTNTAEIWRLTGQGFDMREFSISLSKQGTSSGRLFWLKHCICRLSTSESSGRVGVTPCSDCSTGWEQPQPPFALRRKQFPSWAV